MPRLAVTSAHRPTWLPVHEGFQDFINHAEMVVAFVLPLHVHKILVQGVEPLGQETGYVKACGG